MGSNILSRGLDHAIGIQCDLAAFRRQAAIEGKDFSHEEALLRATRMRITGAFDAIGGVPFGDDSSSVQAAPDFSGAQFANASDTSSVAADVVVVPSPSTLHSTDEGSGAKKSKKSLFARTGEFLKSLVS